MKKSKTLIISGASITASPWFTWADIVQEILKPDTTFDLSARGTGNYYIVVSCINLIVNQNISDAVCMPMFTNIDKLDLYLNSNDTINYINEKHGPLTLQGKQAKPGEFSFWSTGSHWPLKKQIYLDNFFDTDVACANTILSFFALQKLCQERNIELIPVFDSNIWDYLEQDLNKFVDEKLPLPNLNLLTQPFTERVKSLLDDTWYTGKSLIQYAIDNNLSFYSNIRKLHPPSDVHLKWVEQTLLPILNSKFECHELTRSFINKIENFSTVWNSY